ncbi:MAG: T9SS type A sorting domain-containing protein [Elusimicrobia bacterium]|nr:T9SS type A sorting domain-containing protein [Candidatus Liberimonas magnetica]
MRKLCFSLFFIITLILVSSSFCIAAPPDPVFQTVKNYSGTLAIFWNVHGSPTLSTDYYIYIATISIGGLSFAQLEGNNSVQKISAPYLGQADMHVFYSNTITNTRYYVSIVAFDSSGGTVSAVMGPKTVTAISGPISITNVTTTVDGINTYQVGYDSQTIRLTFTVAGTGDGFDPTSQPDIFLDIVTAINVKSTLLSGTRIQVPIITGYNLFFSSTTFSCTPTFTWDCFINEHGAGQHKHNGGYFVRAYPSKTAADFLAANYVNVDVTHINIDQGIVYTSVGDVTKELHYGPPFKFNYYLSKNGFVTMKIWDRKQTPITSDDTLVRVVVSSAPRKEGDNISSIDKGASPDDWDKTVQVESWDGRNEKGLIVNNDVYRYTVDAIEFWGQSGSFFNKNITDSHNIEGTIAFDVLRLINVASLGITQDTPLGHIKYTLAGANSQMGGAKIKIIICSPGTTFYMSQTTGSLHYLSSSTYSYVPGDPIPFNKNNIKKVFVFNRSAGDQDETWDGYDEAGMSLPNDNYVFTVSGIDDSGNHAIDNSGNDKVIIGNITIDKTVAQVAGDSTAPTITDVTVDGTSVFSVSPILSQPFTTITVTLEDTGGSSLSLSTTTGSGVTVLGGLSPTSISNAIAGTHGTSGGNVITFTCAPQSTYAYYKIQIVAKDNAGNTTTDNTKYSFSLSVTQAGLQAALQQSIYVYPNPAKGVAAVTFAYNAASVTTATLEVFNILGELVYTEPWPAASGEIKRPWGLINQAGKKLATGLYLYRINIGNSSDKKALNKLVIVQ